MATMCTPTLSLMTQIPCVAETRSGPSRRSRTALSEAANCAEDCHRHSFSYPKRYHRSESVLNRRRRWFTAGSEARQGGRFGAGANESSDDDCPLVQRQSGGLAVGEQ